MLDAAHGTGLPKHTAADAVPRSTTAPRASSRWIRSSAGSSLARASIPTSDFPRPEDANSTPNIDFWSYNSYPGKNWWKRKCQDGSCDGTAQWWAGDCPAGLVDQRDVRPPVVRFDWLAQPEDCLDRTCDAMCPDGACDGKCAGNGEERGHYVSFFELYYKASTKPLLITEYGIDAYETLWPKASAHESLYECRPRCSRPRERPSGLAAAADGGPRAPFGDVLGGVRAVVRARRERRVGDGG